MSTTAKCLACSGEMSVTPQQVGTEVTCPHCQVATLVMTAPVPPPTPPAPRAVPPQSPPPPQTTPAVKTPRPPKQLSERQVYLNRIRSETSYPALRAVLGFGLGIGLLIGGLFGCAILLGALAQISMASGFVSVGLLGTIGAAVVLVFHFVACFAIYQAGVVIIDIADVAIDQAKGDAKTPQP